MELKKILEVTGPVLILIGAVLLMADFLVGMELKRVSYQISVGNSHRICER